MKFGVQYYPEHWPRERWTIDAAMMHKAGVNVVRMGEFAWSAYEQHEGHVDFSWMEQAIELFGQHGIKTILCTCSRTPPPWAYAAYPGIANVWRDGSTSSCDSRYGVGLDHAEFIELSQRIDSQVIQHFAGNDHIVAWQVDNEIGSGNDCYCSRCHTAFREYLKKKYGTIEALNAAWGEHFWAFSFTDFHEIPLPKQHPQLGLEYRRFQSAVNTAFTKWRTQLIHKLDPGKPVTANFQNIYAAHTDCNALAQVVDVSGMNHYPARTPELAIDYYRGPRPSVWALEQQTRLSKVDMADGSMRLWAWMTIAHGANAIVYFRWRQCPWGNEQFCDGILPHAGQENRFYHELARMGAEIKEVGTLITQTRPRSAVAIVYSYESRWGTQTARLGQDMDPTQEAADYHKALARHVTSIDAMDPSEALSPYALVIAPRLWMVNETLAAQLTAYVEGGGTLCLTAGSGTVDAYGKSFTSARPGLLSELTGITISDLACEKNLTLPLMSSALTELDQLQASYMAEEIHLHDAEAVATHASGWRAGLPAITLHRMGKGQVVYVGVRLEQPSVQVLVNWLCDLSGIKQQFDRPEGVSVYERAGNSYRLLFIINWTDASQEFDPGPGWRDAFTQQPAQQVTVPAHDLRILIQDKPDGNQV